MNSNWLKALSKTSFLSQVVNVKNKLSDLESIAKSKGDFELNEEAGLFSRMLALDID